MRTRRNHDLKFRIDHDFRALLFPYHVFQCFFFVNKFRFHQGSIIRIIFRQIFISIVLNIVNIVTYYFFIFILPSFNFDLYSLIIYIANAETVVAVVIVTCSNIMQRNKAINMMLNLQDIERNMKMQFETSVKKYMVSNWAVCITSATLRLSIVLYRELGDPYWNWAKSCMTLCSMILDLEIFYVTFLMKFLTDKISALTRAVRSYSIDPIDRITAGIEFQSGTVMFSLFKIVQSIMVAFEMVVSIFQTSILLYVVKGFFQSLALLQVIIMWTESKNGKNEDLTQTYFAYFIELIVWVTKKSCVLCLLSAFCQGFCSRVSELTAACASLMENEIDDASRKIAKNVIRLCKSRSSKFSVCGLFTMDAMLPLRLTGLVATYCIVLLQFSFL